MIWLLSRGRSLVLLLAAVSMPAFLSAQEPEPTSNAAGGQELAEIEASQAPSDVSAGDDSASDGLAASQEATGDEATGDSGQPAATEEPPQMTPEQEKAFMEEFDKLVAKFNEVRSRLEQAIWDQREIYIHYANHEQRSSEAKRAFLAQRQVVRQLLDETFTAARNVCRMAPETEAATYLITMIQHRFERDIYDARTMEGAARMIDGGSRFTYLYQTAARSAVCVGEFEMAKSLFEAIDEDQQEEIDLSLAFHLDVFRETFEFEKAERAKEAKEDRLPRVLLHTSQGDVLLELFLDNAPSTVSHFISLVESGFYDGLDFYQVIDHLLALTGDPTGTGSGNCGKYIADEHKRENARSGFRGSLVMAKLPMGDTGKFVPNSASSQFAVLLLPVASVSSEQTIFGRVIEGMDVISRMHRVDPSKKKEKGKIVQLPDMIIEATVVRRPDSLPEPEYVQPGAPG